MNSKTVGPANPDRSNVESEAQEVILEKSRTLAPLCQPLTTSAPRPAARAAAPSAPAAEPVEGDGPPESDDVPF